MILGGLFLIFSRMLESFGYAYQIPSFLSHMVPPLLLGGAALILLRRTV